uniref:Sec-independent protein translocase component TatC n=1 Tax=Gracilariopsis longissima TaxID=172976 RepID=A0A345UBH8_9FLOR|nr:Sec-independent protein translocase component TatC [Gracilariopsis longissima]AXI97814.1 Sec-independent protein translocase component TatC [Gracilariopsis longissima]UAD89915.1 Sec-independent protein translocase component TatC [Gracilariopsis longissima]
MYPNLIYFYSLEFGFRLFYIFISFCLCLIVNSFNIYNIIFFETYPFLKLASKKFIVTNVMDLFDVICLMFFSKSFFFSFPYVMFQLYKFNSSSWYTYQCVFFKKSIKLAFLFSLAILIFIHIGLLPSILQFLTKWEISTDSIINIFVEFRLINYVKWVLTFRYFISSICFFSFLIFFQLWFLLSIELVYFLTKYYRKIFTFSVLFILFLVTPPDGFLQIFFTFFAFVIFEIVFLFVCYKLSNIN